VQTLIVSRQDTQNLKPPSDDHPSASGDRVWEQPSQLPISHPETTVPKTAALTITLTDTFTHNPLRATQPIILPRNLPRYSANVGKATAGCWGYAGT
jgi:hypothetical protein